VYISKCLHLLTEGVLASGPVRPVVGTSEFNYPFTSFQLPLTKKAMRYCLAHFHFKQANHKAGYSLETQIDQLKSKEVLYRRQLHIIW